MKLIAVFLFSLACWGIEPEQPTILKVRRIYVDRLTGDQSAAQIRDMIINALQAAGSFVITENADRADATLKGSAEDLVFTDTFQSSDGINARASIGGSTSSRSSGSQRGFHKCWGRTGRVDQNQ